MATAKKPVITKIKAITPEEAFEPAAILTPAELEIAQRLTMAINEEIRRLAKKVKQNPGNKYFCFTIYLNEDGSDSPSQNVINFVDFLFKQSGWRTTPFGPHSSIPTTPVVSKDNIGDVDFRGCF